MFLVFNVNVHYNIKKLYASQRRLQHTLKNLLEAE